MKMKSEYMFMFVLTEVHGNVEIKSTSLRKQYKYHFALAEISTVKRISCPVCCCY